MNSFNLRLKPFDVVIIIIAIITILTLIGKGIAYFNIDMFGCAIITAIVLLFYVKRADFFS